MAINTSQGTRIYVGPATFAEPASPTAYAALTYVEMKNLESISPLGDQAGNISFSDMALQRVRKFKGARDAGQVTVTTGHDPLDPGQIAAIAAEKTNNNYAFKMTLVDAADANDTNSVFYFLAKVMQARVQPGDANSILKREYVLDIDTKLTEVASIAVP